MLSRTKTSLKGTTRRSSSIRRLHYSNLKTRRTEALRHLNTLQQLPCTDSRVWKRERDPTLNHQAFRIPHRISLMERNRSLTSEDLTVSPNGSNSNMTR